MKRHGLVLLSTMLGTAGCLSGCLSMAPRDQRPVAPVPPQWPSGPAYQQASPTTGAHLAKQLPWQDFILDSRLRQVVAQALKDSRSLREQAAAVLTARAQYRVQRAQLLPALNAGVSVDKSRSLLAGFPGVSGGSVFESETDQATVGLSSW